MENKKVVTRFAPSPTGFLHIGGARTTLFNYLFTKKMGGKMLLRIEDTDKERSKKEYEENIFEGLKWLGLPFDGTPIRQSERTAIYKKYLEKLIADGKAYISKETPKEPGDRTEVIRLKNQNKKITFDDMIRGEIQFDTTELKDFVIAKSLEEPLYHLAVVIDDFEMGITHVIRGEDHISNTPRQILIQEAIGAPRPVYAHLPLILAPDKSKLSKRKHGEGVSLPFYRNNGYLPEAMINFLALLGWNPGTEQEIFTLPELVEKFEIEKVHKAGAVFNIEKLNWVNKEYLKKLPLAKIEEELAKILPENYKTKAETIRKISPIVFDRIETFGDIKKFWDEGEFLFFFETPAYDATLLIPKKVTKEDVISHLTKINETLGALSESDFEAEKIKASIWDYAGEKGRGAVLWPMRFALSGREKSPDPFLLASNLGKSETLTRIQTAIKLLS